MGLRLQVFSDFYGFIFGTPRLDADGSLAEYNPHHIGVWYNNSVQKWSIYEQDRQNMPVGTNFHVFVIGE